MENSIKICQVDDGSFRISVLVVSTSEPCVCQDFELTAQDANALKEKITVLIDEMFVPPKEDVFSRIFEEVSKARGEDIPETEETAPVEEIAIALPVKAEEDTPISQMTPEKRKKNENKMMR